MSLKDTLIGLFIITLWGMNFVVIIWGLDSFPPFLLGATRFLLVALIGSLFIRVPLIPWYWLSLYALFMGVGQFAFLFWGMHVGMPAGLASLVLQSQTIFTAIFAVLWLREPISFNQLLALAVSSIGLVLIGNTLTGSNMTTLGFTLTITASTCWALGNIINKVMAKKGYPSGIALVVRSAWFAVPPLLSASFIFEGSEAIYNSLSQINLSTVSALLYLSLGASVLGFGLWGHLLAKYPASQVTPLSLGVPVIGFISASFFLEEKISFQQGIGISVVLLGLALSTFHSKIKLHFTKITERI